MTSRWDKKASLFVPNDRVQIEQDKICNLKMKRFLHMKITQILDKKKFTKVVTRNIKSNNFSLGYDYKIPKYCLV